MTSNSHPSRTVGVPHADRPSDIETNEEKRIRKDGAGIEDKIRREQAKDPALMPGGDPAGAA